jgi:hypothetical protein
MAAFEVITEGFDDGAAEADREVSRAEAAHHLLRATIARAPALPTASS